MKVLLIGEHFSKNLGDQLIGICFRSFLESKKIEYSLLDLSNNKQTDTVMAIQPNRKSIFLERVKVWLRKNVSAYSVMINIRNAKQLYTLGDQLSKDCDLAIYDGGSLFMDYFAARQYYVNGAMLKNNVPIVYHSCGMGPINHSVNLSYLKKAVAMPNVKRVTLRDSVERFERTFSCPAEKSYDIALLTSDLFIRETPRNSIVGIGCISLNEAFDNVFYNSITGLITKLESRGIKWELFTNGDLSDYNKMQELYHDLEKKHLTKCGGMHCRPQSVTELVSCISRYEKIITCRLHSAIIAYSFQIPAFIINWSDKVQSFYEDICHLELVLNNDFDEEYVADRILNLSYNHEDFLRLSAMKSDIRNHLASILSV